MTCSRWVCIHANGVTRLEVGDSWWEGDRLCHCHHVSLLHVMYVTVLCFDHMQDGKITCTGSDDTVTIASDKPL